jgi:hypothetical protein
MTAEVTKVVGGVVLGYPSNRVIVSKVVGFVIYDTHTLATPTAHVKKRVSVRGRIYYPAS